MKKKEILLCGSIIWAQWFMLYFHAIPYVFYWHLGRCYFVLIGVRTAKYCDECVCMSVCLSVRWYISKTARPNFSKLSVHVTSGRGSVQFSDSAVRYVLCGWRRIFHMMGHWSMASWRWQYRHGCHVAASKLLTHSPRSPYCSTLSWYTTAANYAPGTASAVAATIASLLMVLLSVA